MEKSGHCEGIFIGRQIAQGLMRPHGIVFFEPVIGDGLDFRDGLEQVGIEYVFAIGPVEAFDVSVLGGFSRLDKCQ